MIASVVCDCGACREIEPEALARLVGWKMTLRALALRMRCSGCVSSPRWAAVQRDAFDAPVARPHPADHDAAQDGSTRRQSYQRARRDRRTSTFREEDFAVTLESMFYLTQSIAAVAIVGSLLFVALEVRSSNQVNRHRAIEELLEDYTRTRMSIAGSPEVARAWLSGLHDYEALDSLDKARFSLTADVFFHTHESIYLHHRGFLPAGDVPDIFNYQSPCPTQTPYNPLDLL